MLRDGIRKVQSAYACEFYCLLNSGLAALRFDALNFLTFDLDTHIGDLFFIYKKQQMSYKVQMHMLVKMTIDHF